MYKKGGRDLLAEDELNEIEIIKVSAGEKIAVLRGASTDGKLHVTELSE